MEAEEKTGSTEEQPAGNRLLCLIALQRKRFAVTNASPRVLI